MATDNKKLQGYIEPSIYKAYEQFKKDRGIDSHSKVLNIILSEFLGVERDQPVKTIYESALIDKKIDAAIAPILRRLEQLESDYQQSTSNLESNLEDDLTNDSLNNLESNPGSNPDSDLPSNLEDDLTNDSLNNLESNSNSDLLDDLKDDSHNEAVASQEKDELSVQEDNEDAPTQVDEVTKKETMTKAEMARYLKVSASSVSNWIRNGKWSKFPTDWEWHPIREHFERLKL